MFPAQLSRVWDGLGGSRSYWDSAHLPSSGMRLHRVQPCRVSSTGTRRIGTTHWRGQGSELNRRYLPLRAHRIFQQEPSPTDQELPQLFQRSLSRGHSSLPSGLQLLAHHRRRLEKGKGRATRRGQSRRTWEFQRTATLYSLLCHQDTISASASSQDQPVHPPTVNPGKHHRYPSFSHRCCPSPTASVASISPSPQSIHHPLSSHQTTLSAPHRTGTSSL